MRHLIRFFALFGVLALVYGCGQSKGPAEVHILDFEAGLDRAEKINLSKIAREVNYIPLETNDSSLIGRITDMICDKENLYIYTGESKTILIYSLDGKHKNTIHREGRGPEEYLYLYSIFLDEDSNGNTAIGGMAQQGKVLIYNLNGDFIRAIPGLDSLWKKSSLVRCIKISDSKYLLNRIYESKDDSSKRSEDMVIIDSEGNIVATLPIGYAKFNIKRDDDMIMVTMQQSVTYIYNNTICAAKGCLDTIYSFNKDYTRKVNYIFDFGKYSHYKEDYFSPKSITATHFIAETNDFLITRVYAPKGDFAATKLDDNGDYTKALVTIYYDKNKKRTCSLAQGEVSGISGFVNDIDGGISFAPTYISPSGDRMYQTIAADLFIEVAEQSNSAKMKEIAAKITEDSNPVLMEVIL